MSLCPEEGKNFLKRYDQAGKAKWLILVIAAGILLLGVILYAGGRWLETRSVEEARGDLTQTEAVETQEYNGVTYQRREGLTSILVMGVDHDSAVESEGAYQGGQGDFQRLIVIDPERQVIRQLKIDRDTMTECTVLGYLGSPIGTKEMQISLAHGFGDGKEESCEYAREAVEGLLLGESIDFYVAMNMDGISELNDLAGGVTVTLEDDFSSIDPAMTKGTTLTLHGDQAETFVRTRRSIGVGTNEARMARQEQYIQKLATQLDAEVKQNQNFVLTAYDAMEPYLYTNIPRGQLANEVWAAKDYERMDTIKPEGTHEIGADGFMEFYPDAASLQQAVLQLFYEQVE